jgi:hypothetical protein
MAFAWEGLSPKIYASISLLSTAAPARSRGTRLKVIESAAGPGSVCGATYWPKTGVTRPDNIIVTATNAATKNKLELRFTFFIKLQKVSTGHISLFASTLWQKKCLGGGASFYNLLLMKLMLGSWGYTLASL